MELIERHESQLVTRTRFPDHSCRVHIYIQQVVSQLYTRVIRKWVIPFIYE